jgi:hypothetical protein
LDVEAGKVLGLVFRVEDIGGRTQDLQVKESGAEVRIELAADVLFDSGIRPGERRASKVTRTRRGRTLITRSCRSGALSL